MSHDTVKGTRRASSANSPMNALSLLVENMIKGRIYTSCPVRVDSVDKGGTGPVGHLSATPLVCQTDANGNTLAPQSLPRLPYARVQGGIAALIIDPEPGDIGIAVFAKSDMSNITTAQQDPVPPGSFRNFDQADGMYLGGILNRAPRIYLELGQDEVATLHAPCQVVINTREATVNASERCVVNTQHFEVNAPLSRFNGNVEVSDNLSWGKEGSGLDGTRARITHGLDVEEGLRSNGGLHNTGGLENRGGSLRSNGIVLETHTHTGVHTGGGSTGLPQ